MEKRRGTRKPLCVDVDIYHRRHPIVRGRTKNIGPHGMLVEIIERLGPFALGDPDALSRGARLEVELTVRNQSGTKRYRLPAEMIRSGTDGIGVMLYAQNPRTSHAIEAYEHWCAQVA